MASMEDEIKCTSPPPTGMATVRRNPMRRARATPAAASAAPQFLSCTRRNRRDIAPFRLQEILDDDIPQIPSMVEAVAPPIQPEQDDISENMKVFLRIRPMDIGKPTSKAGNNAIRPKIKKENVAKNNNAKLKKDICLVVKDSRSVMLTTPASLQESKRTKMVIYDGFRYVFAPGSLQDEVYEKVMEPLVSDFLRGKSGLLAALGPSGSGKTHTIFGCPRDPGIVPHTLRRLFERINSEEPSRSYYISVFEVYSERGKGEKIFDLTSDRAELCLQQSAIKGLQENMVSDVKEAECLIACAMLKRATAITNANSNSSRSQCIINISRFVKKIDDGEAEFQEKNAVLTIVDLAGAERERKTGNQGARLLESNFINNTSMVFGLCLRSLLEHQKNPRKPLQKHFQNSLLTRYLRDYLEGKKRMTLILTAKPGEDDYLDTSYLLRQASPYMKIKFNHVEEHPQLLGQKRLVQKLSKIEQPKRRKVSDEVASVIDEGEATGHDLLILPKGQVQEPEHLNICGSSMRPLKECNECKLLKEEYHIELAKREREYQIMQNFCKALWDVLKQYKIKLEQASESEVHDLKEGFRKENIEISELEDVKVHAEVCAPKPDVLECCSTSNLCDMVASKSLEMPVQVHAEVCAPNPKVLESSKTSNSCDVVSRSVEMPFQVPTEVCASRLEVLECSNISNLCDVVSKSLEMSPQCMNLESNSTPKKENNQDSEVRENLEVKDSCLEAGSVVGTSQCQTLVGNDDSSLMEQKDFSSEGEKESNSTPKKKNNGDYLEEQENLEVEDSCSDADTTGSVVGTSRSQALVGNESSSIEQKDFFSEGEKESNSTSKKENNQDYLEKQENFQVKGNCSDADTAGLSGSGSVVGTSQSQALVGNADSSSMEQKDFFSEGVKESSSNPKKEDKQDHLEELENLEVKYSSDADTSGSVVGTSQSQALVGNDDSSSIEQKDFFSEGRKESNNSPKKKNNRDYLEDQENLEVKDSCLDADTTGLSSSGSAVGNSQSQAPVGNDDSSSMEQKDFFIEGEKCMNQESNSTCKKEKNRDYLEEQENLEVKDRCSDADTTGLSGSGSVVGTSQSQALVGNEDSSSMEQKDLFSEGEKIPKCEVKQFSNRPSDVERPKRRLGPPPSLLLKDVSNFDLQDDDKRKESKGGKKLLAGAKALTQGSISLLKKLGNYHHPY